MILKKGSASDCRTHKEARLGPVDSKQALQKPHTICLTQFQSYLAFHMETSHTIWSPN